MQQIRGKVELFFALNLNTEFLERVEIVKKRQLTALLQKQEMTEESVDTQRRQLIEAVDGLKYLNFLADKGVTLERYSNPPSRYDMSK